MRENCGGDALVACNCSKCLALAQGSCCGVTLCTGALPDALHPTCTQVVMQVAARELQAEHMPPLEMFQGAEIQAGKRDGERVSCITLLPCLLCCQIKWTGVTAAWGAT